MGKKLKKVYWANQFDNTINKLAHIETIAQEILKQTDNKVHGFICSVGTGGTLAGTVEGLKEKNKDIITGLCDQWDLHYIIFQKNFLHQENR